MNWMVLCIFLIGYIFIIFEQKIRLDKAAIALITGVLCWVSYAWQANDVHGVNESLLHQVGEIAGILFFLIGAMTIVELIDLYDGFDVIIQSIKTRNKRKFLLLITVLTFFLSAVLDNLTTAIIMSSLIVKILSERKDRLYCIGMVVIAANAGGAWSPIGDVTTTMLWMGNQISALGVMKSVFIPSVAATLIPLGILLLKLKGDFTPTHIDTSQQVTRVGQSLILYSGIGLLLFVPVFKTITHLPPFMGMMLAVGIVWIISETLHKRHASNTTESSSIFSALERIDMPSILFFLGILIGVGALQEAGILQSAATMASTITDNYVVIISSVGILSAIFDNVPLVAALQGMYSLQDFPSQHFFWNYLAYCSGTGGSILIIGSAAGVAAMGIEKIDFFWYVKHISWIALLGYIAGALVCILLN
ncbi:MAG: sodium:proton antiporter NhaD [Bacteroidetes bacterium]|nr:sodium:proton antiporter NhaD [Bacteroidota bacterium]